jgi:septal ring factor EnvC (AmiA/AmiB activator)
LIDAYALTTDEIGACKALRDKYIERLYDCVFEQMKSDIAALNEKHEEQAKQMRKLNKRQSKNCRMQNYLVEEQIEKLHKKIKKIKKAMAKKKKVKKVPAKGK